MFASLFRTVRLYRLLYRDARTSGGFRAMLWAAGIYLLFPFDLVPDYLPVIGQLDDIVTVPTLLYLALRWVEPALRRHYEGVVGKKHGNAKKHDDGVIEATVVER